MWRFCVTRATHTARGRVVRSARNCETGDKGLEEVGFRGGYPQKSSLCARGVSLTRPESAFLDRLTDPFADPDSEDEELLRLGRGALLREEDVAFIREWVSCQGVHWLSCEEAGIDRLLGARVLRNPVVRRIINAAAELTQRMRNPFLPEAVKDNAADKLAKLKGFYPDASGKGGGQANIQINFVNPYAQSEVVASEAD